MIRPQEKTLNEENVSSFLQLGLREELVAALSDLGYEAPTPIQAKTIPVLLAGHDVIGQAQTGTGKTAAFALPILERIDLKRREPQAIVLTPTRELAIQVAEAIHSYSKRLGSEVVVMPVYGGAPIFPQLKRLERGVHVVVGTPGRVIDHLDRKSLKLDTVRFVVLDEGDEMLRMGFIDDVEKILSAVPKERQIALFSATMPREIKGIADRTMRSPQRLSIESHAMAAPEIEQRFLNVSENQKLSVLMQMLELEPSDGVLIFRRTKNGAAELAEKLEGRGFAAVALHGDMTQQMRESVVRRMRTGQIDMVVATDVAARGLDIEQITHVINYDVPYDVEAYVHRIGRTGRAGRTGLATLFITPRERRMLREFERHIGVLIKPAKIPTHADVAAHRIAQFKETIRKTISEGELDTYLELVEQLVDEGPFDMSDVAAAAVRLATQNKPVAAAREEPRAPEEPLPRERPAPRREFRRDAQSASALPESFDESRQPARDVPRRREPPHDDRPKARLSISVGKRDGIRPADIVGSIANEADVPGREIGPIEIGETTTYVGVPAEYAEKIIRKVSNARFRGHKLDVQLAGENAPPPRREPRDFEARPQKRFEPKGEKRYTPRGDKPYRRTETAGPARRPSSRDAAAPAASPFDRFKKRTPAAGARDEKRPSSTRPPSRFGDKPRFDRNRPGRSDRPFGKPKGGPKRGK